MNFCTKCDNMYYIRISSTNENDLTYYCRNCGNEDTSIDQENVCVSKMQLKREQQKIDNVINKYTKLDPTLPRTNTIKCPNTECISNTNKNEKQEVVYIRYDDMNMLYIYLCAKCDTTWDTKKN